MCPGHFCVSGEHFCVSREHSCVSGEQFCVSGEHFCMSREHFCVSGEHFCVSREHSCVSREQFCRSRERFCVSRKRFCGSREGPRERYSNSDAPTTRRAGASREGKGRVPLPLVAVGWRHREWLGGTEAQSQTSTRHEARGLGGFYEK